MLTQAHSQCKLLMNSSLSQNDLLEMVNGDALAIRVPDFYPKSYCQKPAQAIIHNKNFGYYSNPGAGNVGKLGMAYYEVQDNPDSHRKYYEESLEYIRQSRNVFAPYLSPMDKVRLELQEIWRYGANLENLEGKTMNVGLSRVFKEKAQARPHQDVLHWDAPNNLNAYQLATQWATNIYLETAEGGELELWNRKLSKQEYESLRTPGSYEVDRRFLGCPDLTIKPEVGDLIIFDATRVHAVSTIKTGIRVTISCFIGYRGEDQPLSYWS